MASIHHMDMEKALKKAKSLLATGGRLLVVGIAKPSTIGDWALEVARVLPSRMLSAFHRMQSSEELSLPTAYDCPKMEEVRSIAKKELPGAAIQYARTTDTYLNGRHAKPQSAEMIEEHHEAAHKQGTWAEELSVTIGTGECGCHKV